MLLLFSTAVLLLVSRTNSKVDNGYFDIFRQKTVHSVYSPDVAVSLPEVTARGILTCLSRCLTTEGCWAVKLTETTSLTGSTVQCIFYTLLQPPSNLTQDTAPTSELAMRRWNQLVTAEERLAGTCNIYLLTGEDQVPDEYFKCSSFVNDFDGWNYHMAKYGRLNNNDRGAGAWCASEMITDPEWIQVFLGKVRLITGIVTQGREKDDSFMWVTSFKIRLSNDGVDWNYYKESGVTMIFAGNTDNRSPVTNMLLLPVYAAYIRIYPLTMEEWTCLRFDVLGC